ncbi:MAG: fimbrial biogenesis outer membrane usher protein [Glaciimonas sp.]|nr:fimbrial biogenesis outer membrane usher protein [Glaciimonas sp.]
MLSKSQLSGRSASRLKPLTAFICATLSGHTFAQMQEATDIILLAQANNVEEFNSEFLSSGNAVDLSRFSRANQLLPGTYIFDVYVNGTWTARSNILLAASINSDVQPCFNRQLFESIGVDLSKLDTEQLQQLIDGEQCFRLSDVISEATASFDMGELKLELSIPQIALNRNARGYVNPALWDGGVTAGLLSYNFNSYQSANRQGDERLSITQNYLGLTGGFNMAGWRLRHNGSYHWGSSAGGGYQTSLTYAQHDLTDWKSQLTVGEAFTDSELFDSISFQGVRVASDDRMLADSQRGFAPVVRGQANSNAKVTIRQNNYLIYETTVAPGPFEINDLYSTGSGGDLQVTVTEADGSEHIFYLPFAGIPQLLRENGNRFSATYGRVRDATLNNTPLFGQATWQHGFSNNLTGYAGGIISQGYLAGLLGTAWNTSFGAFALDLSTAETQLPKQKTLHGFSTRLSYSKRLTETNTNIALAAYRYSTEGYLGFNDAVRARDYAWRDINTDYVPSRQRSRLVVSLNQKLRDKFGSLYVTGFTQNYWNKSGRNVQFQAGYRNVWNSLNYSLSATRQRDEFHQDKTSYNINVSFPLGKISAPMNLSSSASRDSNGAYALQSTLSGTAGERNTLSYGVTAGKQGGGNGSGTNNGSAFAQYRSPYANLSVNAGAGSGGSQQAGFGVAGAVVAHPGGVTLSQQLNDTIGIIEARDAAGAQVLNGNGVLVDSRGYAVLPYLTPYHLNAVELSPKGLSLDVELESTSQRVAPRAGAVVMLKYTTSKARSAMINSRKEDGKALPFGASVLDEQGEYLGVVGQDSRIFIRGAQDSGVLTVNWGSSADEQCHIAYTLEGNSSNGRYATTDGICTQWKS